MPFPCPYSVRNEPQVRNLRVSLRDLYHDLFLVEHVSFRIPKDRRHNRLAALYRSERYTVPRRHKGDDAVVGSLPFDLRTGPADICKYFCFRHDNRIQLYFFGRERQLGFVRLRTERCTDLVDLNAYGRPMIPVYKKFQSVRIISRESIRIERLRPILAKHFKASPIKQNGKVVCAVRLHVVIDSRRIIIAVIRYDRAAGRGVHSVKIIPVLCIKADFSVLIFTNKYAETELFRIRPDTRRDPEGIAGYIGKNIFVRR